MVAILKSNNNKENIFKSNIVETDQPVKPADMKWFRKPVPEIRELVERLNLLEDMHFWEELGGVDNYLFGSGMKCHPTCILGFHEVNAILHGKAPNDPRRFKRLKNVMAIDVVRLPKKFKRTGDELYDGQAWDDFVNDHEIFSFKKSNILNVGFSTYIVDYDISRIYKKIVNINDEK